MSFLSRFKSSSKEKEKSTPSSKSSSTPTSPTILSSPSLLPALTLPSPSFATEASTPSPSLNGGQTWIKVDDEIPSTGSEEEREERVRGEMRRMNGAELSVNQVRELSDLCGKVVRERGSTTLGLFRPYRLSSSSDQIRQLAILFLSYATTLDPTDPDSSEAATRISRAIFGPEDRRKERLDEELRWAGVHDVVAFLKWGLRHLTYPLSTTFSGPSTPALQFFSNFLSTAPTSTFSSGLLPLLPQTSQDLLLSLLGILESVSANQEYNGISPRRLCRGIGFWVLDSMPPSSNLGLIKTSSFKKEKGNREWASWKILYEAYQSSGDVLETVFRLFLAEQIGLPSRLREVSLGVVGEGKRLVRVLVVEIERIGDEDGEEEENWFVNDQETGMVIRGRRVPLVVFRDAVEATGEGGGDGKTYWDSVRDVWREKGFEGVLSEETGRILKLVGLDSLPPSREGGRRRSLTTSSFPVYSKPLHSLSEEVLDSTTHIHLSNFPNRSVGKFKLPSTISASTDWNDFARTGFGGSNGVGLDEFGVLSEEKEVMIIPRFGDSTITTRTSTINKTRSTHRPLPPSTPSTRKELGTEPKIRLIEVSIQDLEEEFQDVWLETLSDPGGARGWPSFLISDLSPQVIASFPSSPSSPKPTHILISETKGTSTPSSTTTIEIPPEANLRRAGSSKSQTPSEVESVSSKRKWNRRMSSIFSVSGSMANRGSGSRTSIIPPTSPTPTASTPIPSIVPPSLKSKRKAAPPLPPLPAELGGKKVNKEKESSIPFVPVKEVIKVDADVGEKEVKTGEKEIKPAEKEEIVVGEKEEKVEPEVVLENRVVKEEEEMGPPTTSNEKLDELAPAEEVTVETTPPVDTATTKESPVEEASTSSWTAGVASLVSVGAATIGLPALGALVLGSGGGGKSESSEVSPAEKELRPSPIVEESSTSSPPLPSEEVEPVSLASIAESPKAEEESRTSPPGPQEEIVTSIEEVVAPPADAEEIIPPAVDEGIPAAVHTEQESELENSHSKANEIEEPLSHPEVTETILAPVEDIPGPPAEEVRNVEEDAGPSVNEGRDVEVDVGSLLDVPGERERRFSLETLKKSEDDVVPSLQTEEPSHSISPVAELEKLDTSTSSLSEPSTNGTTPISPVTPVKKSTTLLTPTNSPTATIGAPLSPTLSSESTTTTLHSSPTTTPVAPAKKFLGSKAIGELMRRKKSSAEKERAEQEAEKERVEKQLREVRKQEKEVEKKPAPVPVSSVRKRVLELEAQQAAAAARKSSAEALAISSTEAALPEKPAVDVAKESLPTPTQETQPSTVKVPQSLSQLIVSAESTIVPTPIVTNNFKTSPDDLDDLNLQDTLTPTEIKTLALPRSDLKDSDERVSVDEGSLSDKDKSERPALRTMPSETSLAETTTSFATAGSQQSDDE